MMDRPLELDLLRTFTAVADTGSFTAAAERVSRTQSAVSMQIKRLEELLGRRVFERTSRTIALTGHGRILIDYARRMLSLHDESLRRLANPDVSGRARVGVTEYFLPGELPRLLARFAGAHPQVQLDVRMGLSKDLRADVRAGRLDVAIVRLEGERAGEPEPFWQEPQVWVASESWERDKSAPIPLAALPPGCVLREFAMETFKRRGHAWRLAYTGSSMASVQAAILAGLGVSILAQSSVQPGMRVLPRSRDWPDPGELRVGLMEGKGASAAIVEAFTGVLAQMTWKP
jgi:DNA-binding transcriptional LysR family regulator